MNKFCFTLEPPRDLFDFNSQEYVNKLIDSICAERDHLYMQHHLEAKYLIMNSNTYSFMMNYLYTDDSLRFTAFNVDMRLSIIKNHQIECRFLGYTVLINDSLEAFEYEIR